VGTRGAFYESAGCLRDVIQNHLFQIVALLAMEPPAGRHFGEVQTEKATVFKAMRPLKPADMVRGQYAGYRQENDVAKNSDVETYCAFGCSSTHGVGMVCRGICALANICPNTATEVLVELKPPPQKLFADAAACAGIQVASSPSNAIARTTPANTSGSRGVA
jgi:glucose-6-phosphate 1-dehydrogenase